LRIFGLNIMTDKTLEKIFEKERQNARQIPNKMISVMQKKQASQPIVRQLLVANRALLSENRFLRSELTKG